MFVILLPIIIAFAASLALIWSDARKSGKPVLETARGWQTLIGAIVGFAAAALTLVLDSNIKLHQERRRQYDQEISLLKSADFDSKASIAGLKNILSALNKISEPGDDTTRCMNAVQISRTTFIRGIRVARRLDQLAGSISIDTYMSVSNLSTIIELYSSSTSNIGVQDCATNARAFMQYLITAAKDGSAALAELQPLTQQLIAKLERDR